jgi:hypothetical protein
MLNRFIETLTTPKISMTDATIYIAPRAMETKKRFSASSMSSTAASWNALYYIDDQIV